MAQTEAPVNSSTKKSNTAAETVELRITLNVGITPPFPLPLFVLPGQPGRCRLEGAALRPVLRGAGLSGHSLCPAYGRLYRGGATPHCGTLPPISILLGRCIR